MALGAFRSVPKEARPLVASIMVEWKVPLTVARSFARQAFEQTGFGHLYGAVH